LTAGVLVPLAATAATTSIALAATGSAPNAELSAKDGSVRYGEAVRLSGAVPGIAGAQVQIAYKRNGSGSWRPVREAETDPAGQYRTRVKPPASGAYRAQADGGEPTGEVPVQVRSVTKLRVKKHVVTGDRVKVKGRVLPGVAGREVKISLPGGDERTKTRAGGKFAEAWKPRSTGHGKVRAIARGDMLATASRSGKRKVIVYRPAHASYYGPGLYGNGLACGGTLSPGTVGVAHKTFPCGTKITFRHGNRSVNARVIDRGPFVAGREFDLTAALKNKLGFGSTGTVLVSR
jgi:hypothetical protein